MKLSLSPENWEAQYSDVEVKYAIGGWKIVIPKGDQSVNYVVSDCPIQGFRAAIKATFKIKSSEPKFKVFDIHHLPSFRLYFQEQGDNWQSDGFRWWSVAPSGSITLPDHTSGTVTLVTAADPALWQGLYGKLANSTKDYANRFEKACRFIDKVGITFGGSFDYGFGHGVSLESGSYKVICKYFEAN